ncbi:MAG: diacylglycerol kinase family lipid kinase [Chloroflexi bacterium]|nr:diacylglycerol kinase family lipid kinase [Chloroflexota bacterium]
MGKRVHVIVNPAAGQDRPILGILNRAFQSTDVDWDVFVTKRAGDGRRLAQEALRAGVDAVAVYGGDGTVMEVASALIGSAVPLAVFPGGTANVLSVELGIPNDLTQACALVCSDARTTRAIDVGRIGDRYFLIRVGLGVEADMVQGADRSLKDRMGNLAYAFSALQALRDPTISRYRLTIDGERFETEGITCVIANMGSIGQGTLKLASQIDVGDGLLDVVVITKADLPSLLSVAASVVTGTAAPEPLLHWQGREITVGAEPRQAVQIDGEVVDLSEVRAEVVPEAVHVIVPAR